ncbi:MAG TPA: LacI family DNA-binding transcriptional regulator [Jiangellaceae bacterium]|nr:LacI family DNA-binding transcriptional regulator [Jiangellaceae bacterium]
MRHPTMEDVAREASVSRALVSLVFRNSPKVADDTRSRVLIAAERLGYRPNANARRLASRTTDTVGVLLRDLHNPFFADIVDGIEAAADRQSVQVLISHARRGDDEVGAIETLLELRPIGLLLLSPSLPTKALATRVGRVPTVIVGREVRHPGFDIVVDDDARGAELAVRHLHELGHQRIVHVSGGRGEAGAAPRIRGYERAMNALGGPPRVLLGRFSEEAGFVAAETLAAMDERPTAVFAANDLIAVGLLSGFDQLGIRVPEDVSLVGYDNTSLARTRHIDLTTIDQPRRAMGELAIDTLLERLYRGRLRSTIHRTTPTLVVRSSTGPASAAEKEKRER